MVAKTPSCGLVSASATFPASSSQVSTPTARMGMGRRVDPDRAADAKVDLADGARDFPAVAVSAVDVADPVAGGVDPAARAVAVAEAITTAARLSEIAGGEDATHRSTEQSSINSAAPLSMPRR